MQGLPGRSLRLSTPGLLSREGRRNSCLDLPDRLCVSDAYDHFKNQKYLQVAGRNNADTLGGHLLSRTYPDTRQETYLPLAQKALPCAANRQRAAALLVARQSLRSPPGSITFIPPAFWAASSSI
jgi:hypothetical protein